MMQRKLPLPTFRAEPLGRRPLTRRLRAYTILVATLTACKSEEVFTPGQPNDLRALAAVREENASHWQLDDLVLRVHRPDLAEVELRGELIRDSAELATEVLLPLAFVRELPTSIDVIAFDRRPVNVVSYKILHGSWLIVGSLGNLPTRSLRDSAYRTRDSLGLKVRLYYRGAVRLDPLLPAIPNGDVPTPVRLTVSRDVAPFKSTTVVTQRSLDAERAVPLAISGTYPTGNSNAIIGETEAIPGGLWLFSSAGLADPSPSTVARTGPFAAAALVLLLAWRGVTLWLRYRGLLARLQFERTGIFQKDPLKLFWSEDRRIIRLAIVEFLLLVAILAALLARALGAMVPPSSARRAMLLSDVQLQLNASADALDNDSLQLSWRFRPAGAVGDSSVVGLRVRSKWVRIYPGEGIFSGRGSRVEAVPP